MFHFSLYAMGRGQVSFLWFVPLTLAMATATVARGYATKGTRLPEHAMLRITFTKAVNAADVKLNEKVLA